MSNSNDWGYSTIAVHTGSEPCPVTGALVAPIYQTSTYTYTYTYKDTEEAGKACKYFASGMSAISGVYLSILKAGDHVICSDVVYGGTYGLFNKLLCEFGVEYDFVDTSVIEEIEKKIRPNTKAIHIETPANPTLRLSDLKAVSKIAKANNIKLVVDNTFMTSYFQKPLELGSDIVVYSGTKYFGGLISLEIEGGLKKAQEFCDNLKFIKIAVSLGDVGTLVEHPASMTHKSLPREERIKSGVTDGLIRLSIGIEDSKDIINDIDQALSKI